MDIEIATRLITEALGWESGHSESTRSLGALSSLDKVRLIVALEESLGRELPPETLTSDTFASVDRLAAGLCDIADSHTTDTNGS